MYIIFSVNYNGNKAVSINVLFRCLEHLAVVRAVADQFARITDPFDRLLFDSGIESVLENARRQPLPTQAADQRPDGEGDENWIVNANQGPDAQNRG